MLVFVQKKSAHRYRVCQRWLPRNDCAGSVLSLYIELSRGLWLGGARGKARPTLDTWDHAQPQKCRCRAGKPHCRSIRLGDCAETGVNFTELLKVAEKSQLSVVHTSACSSHCRRHAAHPHSNVNVDDQQYNQEVSELMSTYSVNLDD